MRRASDDVWGSKAQAFYSCRDKQSRFRDSRRRRATVPFRGTRGDVHLEARRFNLPTLPNTHTHTKKNYVFDKARRVDSDNANALGPHSGRETPLTYAASNLLPSARMSTKMKHPSRTRDETNQNDTKRSKCLRVRPHEATVYTLDSVHRFAKRGDDQHAGRRKHILQRVFRFVRSLRTPRRFARCTVTSVGAGQKMLFLVRSSNAFSALITYARKFPGA